MSFTVKDDNDNKYVFKTLKEAMGFANLLQKENNVKIVIEETNDKITHKYAKQ